MSEDQTLVLPGRELSGRFVRIEFKRRQVWCLARLHDELAPRNCEMLWNVLPQIGAACHAKYARNEVYAMVDRFTDSLLLENQSLTPLPGDVMMFDFTPEEMGNPAYGYDDDSVQMGGGGATDLAIFYGRNNCLFNADVGHVRGSVVATIVWGLEEMSVACNEVWRNSLNEQLMFSRVTEVDLLTVRDETILTITRQLDWLRT